MNFILDKKQTAAIGVLLAGFLIGGAILWRQGGARFLGANLSQSLAGAGEWTEIKPRVADTAYENSESESAGGQNSKTAKAQKPLPVEWCPAAGAAPSAAKSVIINEVAWMGSAANYSDEWIELKNITDQDIDLSGWQLQNKNQKIKISFSENEILPPGGLYLLERTDDDSAPQAIADKIYKGTLANKEEAVYLFDAACRLADAVLAGAKWPAGDNASKKTMVRLPDFRWQTSALSGGTPRAGNK